MMEKWLMFYILLVPNKLMKSYRAITRQRDYFEHIAVPRREASFYFKQPYSNIYPGFDVTFSLFRI